MSTQASSEQTQAWLAKLPAQQEAVVTALRAQARSVAPDAREVF
jgi:hypothetical protein